MSQIIHNLFTFTLLHACVYNMMGTQLRILPRLFIHALINPSTLINLFSFASCLYFDHDYRYLIQMLHIYVTSCSMVNVVKQDHMF